jgi:hypothetical protein
MPVSRLWPLAILALWACGRRDAPTTAEAPARGSTAAQGVVPPATPARRGAAAAPGATASGGEESSAATITECPKTLKGAENVNRVITKECGVVTVTDDYHLNYGELTLEPGATLAFREGTSLNVGYNDTAKLIVKGTAEQPVRFTSAGDHVPGVWKGVHLFDHADRSSIDHLVVEYAGDEGDEAIGIEAQDVVLTSTTVRQVKGIGVAFGRHGTALRMAGMVFEAVGGWPISIGPAAVDGMTGPSTFPDGSVVHVYGGTIEDKVTWRQIGAPYFVSEDVDVEGASAARGVLTIEAGVDVRFGPEAHLLVGYSQPAAVETRGTEEAPVVLGSNRETRPGSWPSVHIYGYGEGTFAGTVFEHGGSSEYPGVLRVDGTAALTSCTFRDNLGGLALGAGGRAKLRQLEGVSFAGNGRGAIWLFPQQVESLGPGNRYADGERIELFGGNIDETATWHAQDTVIEVLGDLHVDGRTVLSVESGSRFAMKDRSRIFVGARDNASLRLVGTAARPIEIGGIRDQPGSWGGIRLEDSSRDSVLEWVRLRDAGGDGGVFVDGEANARIAELSCARCAAPALVYACSAKVSATSLHAEDGTEVAEAPCR